MTNHDRLCEIFPFFTMRLRIKRDERIHDKSSKLWRRRLQGRTVDDAVEVHVGVSEGATSERVAADTDGGDGADLVEELEDDTLGDIARGGSEGQANEAVAMTMGRGHGKGIQDARGSKGTRGRNRAEKRTH